MNLDQIPNFLHPRLRLFMSIDLVGSTALKQSGIFPIKAPKDGDKINDVGARWFLDIANFYSEFQAKFARHWQGYCTTVAHKHQLTTGEAPQLWKSNGDELIYVKEIGNVKECAAAIVCWLRSGREYRQQLRAKGSKLDVKMSAWVAGFPIVNSEVIFQPPSDPSTADNEAPIPEVLHYDLLNTWHSGPEFRKGLTRDFIGPSIDTGFRIASKATPRKFTLSIEAAYIFAMARMPKEMNDTSLQYGGQEALKGVLGGKPYPMFWIDTQADDELAQLEDRFEKGHARQNLSSDDICNYCREFMLRNENNMISPFIVTDTEKLISLPPDNYEALVRHMAKEWSAARVSDEIFVKSFSDEAPGSEDAKADVEQQIPDDLALDLPPPQPSAEDEQQALQ